MLPLDVCKVSKVKGGGYGPAASPVIPLLRYRQGCYNDRLASTDHTFP